MRVCRERREGLEGDRGGGLGPAQADWEALEDRERARYGYETDLKKYLDRLMVELKAKIKRNEERLAAVEKPLLLQDDQVNPKPLTPQKNKVADQCRTEQ